MKELDLLLIRQREHEIASLELKQKLANMDRQPDQAMSFVRQQQVLQKRRVLHIEELEQQGIDYFTITAEMARIRAEVRGEK